MEVQDRKLAEAVEGQEGQNSRSQVPTHERRKIGRTCKITILLDQLPLNFP